MSLYLADNGRAGGQETERFLFLPTAAASWTSVVTLTEIVEWERRGEERQKERKEERNHLNNEATAVLRIDFVTADVRSGKVSEAIR